MANNHRRDIQPATIYTDAPYDEDIERALIGSVLIEPTIYFGVSSSVAAADFYITRHQYVWEAFDRLAETREPIERYTVRRALEELGYADQVDDLYISTLVNSTPSALYANHYASLVARDASRRRLMVEADRIHQTAADKGITTEDVFAQAMAGIQGVYESARSQSPYHVMQDIAAELLQEAEANEPATGQMTGFNSLDTLTNGLHRGELVIVAGRPGMGKSAFALSIAHNMIRQGRRVGLFSLEMDRKQITQRLLAITTGMSIQTIRARDFNQQQMGQYVEALGRVSTYPLFINDEASLTPENLRLKSLKLKFEQGLDLLIVDYLQLMHAQGYNNNRVQEISYISRHMKELARELNVPLLSAAQLSRAVEQRADKRPQLSDLRESGSIEQDADIVAFLYRDVVYNEATEFPNQAELIVAKHRNGETTTLPLYFDPPRTHYREGTTRTIDLSQL